MKRPIMLFAGGLAVGLAAVAGVLYMRGHDATGVTNIVAADSADAGMADVEMTAELDATTGAALATDEVGESGVDVALSGDTMDLTAVSRHSVDTASGAAALTDDTVATDVVRAGDTGLDRARLIRILGAMKPAEAARIVAELSDDEAAAVLGALPDRKAALLLAGLAPERAAAIGRIALGERSGR